MHELVLSKEQMRKMRQLLGRKGIYFPYQQSVARGEKEVETCGNTSIEWERCTSPVQRPC